MIKALDHLYAAIRREGHDEVYRLLLHHGTAFEPSDPPEGLPVPKSRSCYFNAFQIAAGDPQRFAYYEGVGVTWFYDGNEATELSLSDPTAHAWCVDIAGKVVDTSWHAPKSVRPAAYVGLPLPLDLVQPFAYVGSRGTFSGLDYELSGLKARLGLAR